MGITVTLMVASAFIGAGITQDAIPKPLLLGLGFLFVLLALIEWRRGTKKRRRVLARARHILRDLIAKGDRLHHDPTAVIRQGEELSPVEQWRGIIGNKLNAPPFSPGTGDWVLTQHGDRHRDPLVRLREIDSGLENWIVEDDA